MLEELDLQEGPWQRLVWVFSGFEAIVFAAVGWFFGREVNRERAEHAETEADLAQQDVLVRTQDVERGIAVANALLAHTTRLQAMGSSERAGVIEFDLEVLQDFCHREFPNLPQDVSSE